MSQSKSQLCLANYLDAAYLGVKASSLIAVSSHILTMSVLYSSITLLSGSKSKIQRVLTLCNILQAFSFHDVNKLMIFQVLLGTYAKINL